MRLAPCAGILGIALGVASVARAGDFDARGDYQPDPAAVAYVDFAKPERYLLDGVDAKCEPVMYTLENGPGALEGGDYLRLDVVDSCYERFYFHVPAVQGSYRASVWVRHGGVDASIIVTYPDETGLDGALAMLSPTGRTTSDGWVELASNEFPIDGAKALNSYLRIANYAARDGTDVDALEIVKQGEFIAESECTGIGDPVCGPEEVCTLNRCVLGRTGVPVLPEGAIRNDVVDVLESQLRVYYGGRRSREIYLPLALAEMQKMRSSTTAWEFWSHWAAGVHALHDWHTDTNIQINGRSVVRHRLNACFFEGDADLSHGSFPKDPLYPDILVSHSGPGAAGLKAGDRLLAVDGMHPVPWSEGLADVNWGFHVATDPTIYSDYAEELGGFSATILRFASEITVLRCDSSGACNGPPETIQVDSLDPGGGGTDVACDNRPFYHFDKAHSPDPENHYVFGTFFRGAIADTTPQEAIFGMVWDTLNGEGNPNGYVNSNINQAVAEWKASARGVILDHRAGNGGTIDAATSVTKLVRPPSTVAAMRIPMVTGAYDGPDTTEEGLALFARAKVLRPYNVGDVGYSSIPVAMIIHRDGSASDYLPFGMKGAPHVRLFGPHPTSGAFSTYNEYFGWNGFNFQIGSGDTIAADGHPLIGHGVEPDETLLPKQSDLLAGKDTLFEAALAWVRSEIGK